MKRSLCAKVNEEILRGGAREQRAEATNQRQRAEAKTQPSSHRRPPEIQREKTPRE